MLGLILPQMTGKLIVSSKQSPFPFGALAIASYTNLADITFDETAAAALLELNGSRYDSEEAIVQAIAQAGKLSEDSVKVSDPITPID